MVSGFLLLPLGFITMGGWAGELEPSDVQITSEGELLSVEVRQPTKLRGVLEQLCQHTGARCELASEGLELDLPPLTIRGTWNEVVQQLLQGTRVNYATLAPAPGQAARLVALNRPRPAAVASALAVDSSTAEAGVSASDRSGAGRAAGESPRYPSSAGEERDGTIPSDRDRAAGESPRERWTEAEPVGQESDFGSADIGGGGSSGSVGMGSGSSPNADSPYHLPPFMGGPPVPPSGEPPGLPFPDENENPIPLSNQPLTGLPFPDENGNPIPLTPLRPGQNPGSPFPPDTPASSTPSGAPRAVSGHGGVGATPPDK